MEEGKKGGARLKRSKRFGVTDNYTPRRRIFSFQEILDTETESKRRDGDMVELVEGRWKEEGNLRLRRFLSLSLCLFPSLSTLERIGFVQVGVVRGSEEGSNDEG